MKRELLTKQNIQAILMERLRAQKNAAIYLTILFCVFVLFYISYIICYANGINLPVGKFSFATPVAVIIIVPFLIAPLCFFLLRCYLKIYKIKAGKFEIIQEKLCSKAEEFGSYYRRTIREKIFYFRCGKIAVESNVYSCANAGDIFYLVVTDKGELLTVYNKKYYEIREI